MDIEDDGGRAQRTFIKPRPGRSAPLAQGEAARIVTPLQAQSELVLQTPPWWGDDPGDTGRRRLPGRPSVSNPTTD